ncbi:MAG TPA: Crp/Fnr family transcriptional regulator [Hypericibacter adhaerens]|jgi:CRP-like cAMP-binding protein|nr:Crp/Fnr family transcriptional regulator [Hypericibacter adhaerens]HWA42767.1 Crp/Fnr family transcriptional regulator [Hypericibacter adhaerens]
MELFLGLSEPALADVMNCARLRHLPKNVTVFAQGQAADRCHALIEGSIRIAQSDEDGAQLVVRFIGPGEMFGTVALFTDRQYPAEAVTMVDSTEISWTEAALLDLIERHPRIALNIVRIIGTRLREAQERLRELATQRVESRIAHMLLRLAAQAGQADGTGTTIGFPLTRKDVAAMCGATLHTASRILTAWEKTGMITTSRQRVTIRKLAAIKRIAEDPGA